MSTNVLAFPAQTVCGVCGRSCSEDDLGGCFTCDTRFCRNCQECECDKQMAELADRLADLKPSLMTRLIDRACRLAYAVRVKLAA
jgi:hypothetical protein